MDHFLTLPATNSLEVISMQRTNPAPASHSLQRGAMGSSYTCPHGQLSSERPHGLCHFARGSVLKIQAPSKEPALFPLLLNLPMVCSLLWKSARQKAPTETRWGGEQTPGLLAAASRSDERRAGCWRQQGNEAGACNNLIFYSALFISGVPLFHKAVLARERTQAR